jgi:hypothetical protein
MSQDQMSEAVALPPVATNDGMFRPGRTQRETLLTVLRLAAGYEQWMTLAELAGKTKFPPASISAQLRHLRKARYGGWVVEKRKREWANEEVVWEYRLAEGERRGEEIGGGMSVKPEMAFDVCWEVYRGAREVMESKRGIAALNMEMETKYEWRPDVRPKMKDWVADFALAGQAALEGPEWASRMVLFRLYYLGLAPYERARHFLGLSERGWVNWSEEIRRRCGAEILRRGMFPPGKYFNGGE